MSPDKNERAAVCVVDCAEMHCEPLVKLRAVGLSDVLAQLCSQIQSRWQAVLRVTRLPIEGQYFARIRILEFRNIP